MRSRRGRIGEAEGAVIAAQSEMPVSDECKDTVFVLAMSFKDVKRDMRIFGLVMIVTSFESEDAAVDIANESRYGLTRGFLLGMRRGV